MEGTARRPHRVLSHHVRLWRIRGSGSVALGVCVHLHWFLCGSRHAYSTKQLATISSVVLELADGADVMALLKSSYHLCKFHDVSPSLGAKMPEQTGGGGVFSFAISFSLESLMCICTKDFISIAPQTILSLPPTPFMLCPLF